MSMSATQPFFWPISLVYVYIKRMLYFELTRWPVILEPILTAREAPCDWCCACLLLR